MYGAIIGDIIGSPFEFSARKVEKDFNLWEKRVTYTDDTVMSVAIADALIKAGKDADKSAMEQEFTCSMQKWGLEYINAGYGGMFYNWLLSPSPQPYGSFGNGSAMRVSPVGWAFDDLDRTREVASGLQKLHIIIQKGLKGQNQQLQQYGWPETAHQSWKSKNLLKMSLTMIFQDIVMISGQDISLMYHAREAFRRR